MEDRLETALQNETRGQVQYSPGYLRKTHITAANAVEDEENVVERDGADEVEEEPRADVVPGDEPRVDDHLLAVVLLHYSWRENTQGVPDKPAPAARITSPWEYFENPTRKSNH